MTNVKIGVWKNRTRQKMERRPAGCGCTAAKQCAGQIPAQLAPTANWPIRLLPASSSTGQKPARYSGGRGANWLINNPAALTASMAILPKCCRMRSARAMVEKPVQEKAITSAPWR